MFRSIVPISQYGHNVNVVFVENAEHNLDQFTSDMNDEINETKVGYKIVSNIDEYKKIPKGEVAILHLKEFNKKIIKSVFRRDTVNIVVDQIEQVFPSYIGLFPDMPDLNKVFEEEKLTEFVKSQTPLHITLEFLGGKKPENPQEYSYGKSYSVNLIGVSDNEAGVCLVVHLPDVLSPVNPAIPHITLDTKTDFTPADVGKKIDMDKILKFAKPYSINAVLAPMFS
jgi:hypothetical protein